MIDLELWIELDSSRHDACLSGAKNQTLVLLLTRAISPSNRPKSCAAMIVVGTYQAMTIIINDIEYHLERHARSHIFGLTKEYRQLAVDLHFLPIPNHQSPATPPSSS